MNVICISEKLFPNKKVSGYKCPVVGEEVTVIRREIDTDGEMMYELCEYPPIGKYYFVYSAQAFAQLNGPDEIAIASNRLQESMDRNWKVIEARMNQTAG